jgi:hypothetical protein
MAIPTPTTTILVPLRLPAGEAQALARLAGRLDFKTVVALSAPCTSYDAMPESDVAWSAIRSVRIALAIAGFAPQ